MPKLQCAAVLVWAAALLVTISHLACGAAVQGGGAGEASAANSADCVPSSCGDIRYIRDPFRLRGDPRICGDPRFELQCEANRTILEIPPYRFWVKAIWYQDKVIRVIDARAVAGPSFLLSPSLSEVLYDTDRNNGYFSINTMSRTVELINCSSPVESLPFVVEASCCMTTTSSRSRAAAAAAAPAAHGTHYLYWFERDWTPLWFEWERNGLPRPCRLMGTNQYRGYSCAMEWLSSRGCRVVGINHYGGYSSAMKWLSSCSEVRDALMQGFNLTWAAYNFSYNFPYNFEPFDSARCPRVCGHPSKMSSIGCFFCTFPDRIPTECKDSLIYFFKVRTSIGYIALLAFLVYKLRRRLLGMNDDVEMFLAEYRSCMPTRYTYRQIRKMTGNFREKLGQGGFGSVFRGKQLTGRPVAIKILSQSDSVNGQDFINEVATIGKIHHANVVQLVGFCVEGSKRALVYELMPHGSLDRYIYDQKEGSTTAGTSTITSPPLISWEKTLEVAVGIARGIEYLHRGCNMKILHFDIKPQNVLLDANFNPKISDFGLAKSYPIEKNTVTVTAVRGTIGYMAPELFYASAGRVSSKSDVYSFGMLLMEMAGRRKNVSPDAGSSFSSEDYLPLWIYNQLEQGKDIAVGRGSTDEEKNIIYKLFIVALWCVQMMPTDRPSMGKVIEMLEGDDVQQLQLPAGKPFLFSTELPVNIEDIITAGSTDSSTEVSVSLLMLPPHASA